MYAVARFFVILSFIFFATFGFDGKSYAGEYPETNPFNAFNAEESQKIIENTSPFIMNKTGPLVRLTITLYKNEAREPFFGFAALTYGGYDEKGLVTYYYAVEPVPDASTIFAVNVSQSWGIALVGVVPKDQIQTISKNIFTEMPDLAKLLWVSPPLRIIAKEKKDGDIGLFAIQGGGLVSGLISWSTEEVKKYTEIQNAQEVLIYVVNGIGVPDSVEWAVGDPEMNGKYEWKPGYDEPKLVPNDLPI